MSVAATATVGQCAAIEGSRTRTAVGAGLVVVSEAAAGTAVGVTGPAQNALALAGAGIAIVGQIGIDRRATRASSFVFKFIALGCSSGNV